MDMIPDTNKREPVIDLISSDEEENFVSKCPREANRDVVPQPMQVPANDAPLPPTKVPQAKKKTSTNTSAQVPKTIDSAITEGDALIYPQPSLQHHNAVSSDGTVSTTTINLPEGGYLSSDQKKKRNRKRPRPASRKAAKPALNPNADWEQTWNTLTAHGWRSFRHPHKNQEVYLRPGAGNIIDSITTRHLKGKHYFFSQIEVERFCAHHKRGKNEKEWLVPVKTCIDLDWDFWEKIWPVLQEYGWTEGVVRAATGEVGGALLRPGAPLGDDGVLDPFAGGGQVPRPVCAGAAATGMAAAAAAEAAGEEGSAEGSRNKSPESPKTGEKRKCPEMYGAPHDGEGKPGAARMDESNRKGKGKGKGKGKTAPCAPPQAGRDFFTDEGALRAYLSGAAAPEEWKLTSQELENPQSYILLSPDSTGYTSKIDSGASSLKKNTGVKPPLAKKITKKAAVTKKTISRKSTGTSKKRISLDNKMGKPSEVNTASAASNIPATGQNGKAPETKITPTSLLIPEGKGSETEDDDDFSYRPHRKEIVCLIPVDGKRVKELMKKSAAWKKKFEEKESQLAMANTINKELYKKNGMLKNKNTDLEHNLTEMEKKYKQVSLKAQELEDKLNTLRNDNETLKNTLAEAEQQRKDALQNDFRAETSGMTEDAMTVQEKLQKEEEARSLKWELKVQFSDQILDYFNKYRQFHRVFDTLKKLGHKIDLREHGIRTEVKVDRAFVVRDVLRCKHFRSAALDGLDAVLGDIQVEFVASSLRRGGKRSVEDGMDAGGLTKELNTLFWKELEHYEYEDKEMRKKIRLFSKENPESSVVLPTKFQDHRGNPCKISLEMQTYYKVVGIMMSRAFLGGMPIPRQYLNSTVLDYLLGFERANTEARKGLRELLEDLLAVDPEYKWVQTIVQDIQNGDKEKTVNDVLHDENMTTLSEENCYEVIKTFIYERIVRPREASLQFIADGFTIRKGGADTPKLPVLTSFIELCSCTKERQTLLCGNEDLQAADLIEVMEFKGYSKADKAKYKGWLGEILEEMTVEQRQQILQFCTGARSLSSEPGFTITVQKGGAGSAGSSTSAGSSGPSAADPPIPSAATATPGGGGGRSGGDGGRVSAARLPEAQTCTDMLRLPLYESKNEMRFKLLGALSNGGLEYFGKK